MLNWLKNLFAKSEETKTQRGPEEGKARVNALLRPHMHLVEELRRLLQCDAESRRTEGGFGSKARIREIGEELNQKGGMDLMQAAYYSARNNGPYFSQDIWDGIGSWRC